MAVLALLLVVLFSALNQTGAIWQRTRNQASAFQSARLAFDLMTRALGQSTLNVYYGYDDPAAPQKYIRKSDLHFVVDPPPLGDFGQGNAVFFQAPLGWTQSSSSSGLPALLNAVGFYVTYGKDPGLPAALRALDRNRFRLMQFLDPSENLRVQTVSGKDWFAASEVEANSTTLAENVILLLFWPQLSPGEDPSGSALTSNFRYDSRLPAAPAPQLVTTNQQPPLVRMIMVAIDEVSANRLSDSSSPPTEITSALSGLFRTSSEAAYTADLQTLETRLNDERIGYRVFVGSVALRESKWSK